MVQDDAARLGRLHREVLAPVDEDGHRSEVQEAVDIRLGTERLPVPGAEPTGASAAEEEAGDHGGAHGGQDDTGAGDSSIRVSYRPEGVRSVTVMLLAIAAGLLVLTVPDLDAPFGPSHDGRNAAMWALASDGIQAHGLVGSKFGARHADGAIYANHPPVTGLVTAASVAVLGRSEVGVRLPGLLTALASIPLLWLLLTRLRLSPHAAAVGSAVALATPMFLGYGPMVDTPTMSFPIALALLAVWLAPRRGPGCSGRWPRSRCWPVGSRASSPPWCSPSSSCGPAPARAC